MKRHWGAVLGAAALLAATPAGPAGAQIVQFKTPEVGDRRVVLRWDPVPGDTLDVEARRGCKDECDQFNVDTCRVQCDALLPDTAAVRLCREACDDYIDNCKAACTVRLFGGYQIWRSTAEDTSQMVLLRTFSVYDTTWGFPREGERIFVDPDSVLVRACGDPLPDPDCNPAEGKAVAPFNGFPYYYAVTWFESRSRTVAGAERIEEFPMQTTAQGRLTTPVQPAATAVSSRPLLGKVLVVPNPFNPKDPFKRASFGLENRVQFINLPSPATVRVYTSSGDLVRILENNDENDSVDWDLKNGDGDEVVGGIYMFVAEAPDEPQPRSGHFVIIR
jgi:hypothetical protein